MRLCPSPLPCDAPGLGLSFRLAASERDLEAATDFYFDVFLRDVPSSSSFGADGPARGRGRRHQGMVRRIREILDHRLTILAEDKESGNIVAMLAAYKIER